MFSLQSFFPWHPRGVPFVDTAPRRRCRPALVSERQEVLEALAGADADIAVWRRPVPEGSSTALATWACSSPPPCDRTYRVQSSDLAPWISGLVDAEARAWLERDIRTLVARFAGALDVDEVRMVLGVVSDDKCRKFHVDNLRMRMVCTYVGPGTEWVDDAWVRREALTHRAAAAVTNRGIVDGRDHVEHANAGDVLWIRGRSWRPGPFGGVHRSPSIAESGQVRLVLVVSPLTP